ncbi:hypothetical protein [Marinobacterium iners]|uniref:Uncharacterized protein n=1 Tax=Marinobacterium iners DSM 11526 TaxID=1122198 RepID=A0A1H3X4B4_9GAMM|nr:hypothetical protein [Marinobacterium iners]SDZ94245.1 hypothetical protein SAMN02745729_10137 [Marinobacterium iners DSM 11526]
MGIWYGLDGNKVFTGEAREFMFRDPVPRNFVNVPPPQGDGFHVWDGRKWFTVSEYPDPNLAYESESVRWPLKDFRMRFTPNEKIALYQAAETNIMIKVFIDDLAATPVVAQDDPDLNKGVAYVVAQGIITIERARKILDNPEFSL